MTMQVMERSHNPNGLFGWFNYERRNWSACAVAALCLGYSLGNGHTTTSAIKDISKTSAQKTAVIKRLETHDIPTLKNMAGCEHARATQLQETAGESNNLPVCPPLAVAKDLGKVPQAVVQAP